eukprot:scaffold4500_cov352-Pinguiococcus_pyrenoidosus.AAC.1
MATSRPGADQPPFRTTPPREARRRSFRAWRHPWEQPGTPRGPGASLVRYDPLVEDHADVRHVQPASSDIGGDEDEVGFCLEDVQGFQSLSLLHLRVETSDRNS